MRLVRSVFLVQIWLHPSTLQVCQLFLLGAGSLGWAGMSVGFHLAILGAGFQGSILCLLILLQQINTVLIVSAMLIVFV